MEAKAQLELVAREVEGCTACALAKTRTKTVPGDGSPTADILFIGEAPGYHEDQQGHPFVGAAGQLLSELLASAGLDRSSVFVANVVKCRPPGNRDPQPDEIQACDHFMRRQIEAIGPRVVVTLGRFSMAKFFQGETISKIHGQPRQRDGMTIVPMFHPAAALHQPSLRKAIEDDFRKLPQIVASLHEVPAVPEPREPAQPDATQLSLF